MQATGNQLQCAHCGENCTTEPILFSGKNFCCNGCRTVYEVLNNNQLGQYYQLNDNPGVNRRKPLRKDKFAFLDDESVQQQLVSFRNDRQTHITLHLPDIHCSSCLWLLENLHKLNEAIFSSVVNFPRREARIIFNPNQLSLRQLAELLSLIGYEPRITLDQLNKKPRSYKRTMIYQLGVAGFCFGNIMMLSFPAYLGLDVTEPKLHLLFNYLALALSLPVLLFSARPFYVSAWKALRNRYLNIDAPIALAILFTFFRSVYEIFLGSGTGYFDSMSGIVFFMLAGRVLQDKTFAHLSFERSYTAYFPVSVTRIVNEKEEPVKLPDIKPGDTLLIHNNELVPADGIITRGRGHIDYSFVTGESDAVLKETGETVYAGGRQTGGNMEILALKGVEQSNLTQLWNNREQVKRNTDEQRSFVQPLSRYFTYIILSLALLAAAWWATQHQTGRAMDVLTTVLIVACPCTLLLSQTLTNAHILSLLSRSGLYLRSAAVIEDMANATHIVFDKTGTLTQVHHRQTEYKGLPLTSEQKQMAASLAAQSTHPLSRNIVRFLGEQKKLPVTGFSEIPGQGISGVVNGIRVTLGSAKQPGIAIAGSASLVQLTFGELPFGYFHLKNNYRGGLNEMVPELGKQFRLSVISGDNEAERENLRAVFGPGATLLFHQMPQMKMDYIRALQQQGEKVMMIGDGLNDAGALQQSDCGVAITDNTNNFTPASDAIMNAAELPLLLRFIRVCRANKNIILISFVLSALYNIVGLYFALQGLLSPIIAAVLMPLSSLTMLALAAGLSKYVAVQNRLNTKSTH